MIDVVQYPRTLLVVRSERVYRFFKSQLCKEETVCEVVFEQSAVSLAKQTWRHRAAFGDSTLRIAARFNCTHLGLELCWQLSPRGIALLETQ